MAEMWYYTTEGKQMDPVSMKELKRLVGDGTLKPTDMVWKEGMERWIRASSVKELFPDPIAALDHYFGSSRPANSGGGSATAVTPSMAAANSPAPVSTVGKKGLPVDDEEESPKKKRRPRSDDDDRDDGRRPPRRRAETSTGGSSVGIVIFVICGLGLLLIGCGGGLAIIIWVGQSGVGKGEPINGQVNYNAFIGPNGVDARTFNFRKGVDYELIVTSQPRNPDVDLFIINPSDGRIMAADDTVGPDSSIVWTPNETGDFRVEVRNLDRMTRVTSVVTIREKKQAEVQGPPEKDKKPPLKDGRDPLPPDVLEGQKFLETPPIKTGDNKDYKFRVRAGHKVTFKVVPSQKGKNIDFNLYVNRDGGDKALLASDERPQATAEVTFVAQITEIVSVRIVNASKGKLTNSAATLFYDVSP
jgi:GYF domain 2